MAACQKYCLNSCTDDFLNLLPKGCITYVCFTYFLLYNICKILYCINLPHVCNLDHQFL